MCCSARVLLPPGRQHTLCEMRRYCKLKQQRLSFYVLIICRVYNIQQDSKIAELANGMGFELVLMKVRNSRIKCTVSNQTYSSFILMLLFTVHVGVICSISIFSNSLRSAQQALEALVLFRGGLRASAVDLRTRLDSLIHSGSRHICYLCICPSKETAYSCLRVCDGLHGGRPHLPHVRELHVWRVRLHRHPDGAHHEAYLLCLQLL